MNQGTKFALALVLIMISSILLFVAFHNTLLKGKAIKSPGDFISWIQSMVAGGPSIADDAAQAAKSGATTAVSVATQAVNQAVTP